MPFYELLCISAHQPQYSHIRNLVRTSALHVLDAGGVVRDLKYVGTRLLPQKMKRAGSNRLGDYWSMHFDCSPQVLRALDAKLHNDPVVIRATTLRLGNQLMGIVKPRGRTTLETLDATAILREKQQQGFFSDPPK